MLFAEKEAHASKHINPATVHSTKLGQRLTGAPEMARPARIPRIIIDHEARESGIC